MKLGSWALIDPPSLIALIPIFVLIAMILRGKNIISAAFVGIVLGMLLTGLGADAMGSLFYKSLGSPTVLIGFIAMLGAGLGALMTEVRVTHTLVLWIVRGIGVNTKARGKLGLMVSSLSVCGMLGTMVGGNSVIAPIMLPMLGSLGVTPTVAAVLMKISGEIGLVLGPLTGVALLTMEMTKLSYMQYLSAVALPFSIVFLAGTWYGALRAQRRTEGKEAYTLDEDVKNLDQMVIHPKERNATIAFLLAFLGLVVFGIMTRQKTHYAVIVMLALMIVVSIMGRIDIDRAVKVLSRGLSTQAFMVVMFLLYEVLLQLVTLGGGFKALAGLMSGHGGGSPTITMLTAAAVSIFGISMAAVPKLRVVTEMFGATALAAGVPMSIFAMVLVASTRITSSLYPASNFAASLGIAQCNNPKEALQACWVACAAGIVAVFAWIIIGVRVMPW